MGWDQLDQLATYLPSNVNLGQASYGYSTDGLRVYRDAGQVPANTGVAQQRYFLYDGGRLMAEYDAASGQLIRAYLWGAAGLVGHVEPGTSGVGGTPDTFSCEAYTFDPSGNAVTENPYPGKNLTGTHPQTTFICAATFLYDAFGTNGGPGTVSTGAWINDPGANPEDPVGTNPIGYMGQFGCYTDYESGYIYCQQRYYSPSLGRWISRDPIGLDGGVNAYEFCGNNPVTGSDPTGFDWIRYDGQQIVWFLGNFKDTSRPLFHLGGTSGTTDHQIARDEYRKGNNTGREWGGPAPHGQYSINLSLNPNRVAALGPSGYTIPGTGLQWIPTNPDGTTKIEAWGRWRARLEPAPSTQMHGRDQVYFHDSGKCYTNGCVECNRVPGELFRDALVRFRALGHKSIRVLIHYASPETSTLGPSNKSGEKDDKLWKSLLDRVGGR